MEENEWIKEEMEWKLITLYSVIKEKFTFLYGGSRRSKPFHPSTHQQTTQSNQKVDWISFIVEWVDWIPLIIITVITWLLFISISLCYKVSINMLL